MILLVEDEIPLAEVIQENLQLEGYEVRVANDGKSALKMWQSLRFRLIILDVMLPFMSGIEICRLMRQKGAREPVLFLSAKAQAADKVLGLEVGGDDYLTKPFHLTEFLARVKSIFRRQAWFFTPLTQTFSFADFTVDFEAWTVQTALTTESLNERELMILRILIERANKVVSRDEILDLVWGQDQYPSSRTIDNFMVRLRKIFETNPAEPQYLHTIWGVGYKFTPDASLKL